ncbi:hypothetical protein C8R44DRAFT_808806 [Mycena epipterygia]|nr:hypothetical protein C8R44DRAFT_808806 [Mycena epipterygia]
MDSLTMTPLKPGLVNLPGATPTSKALVAELLYKDFKAHHCFFNDDHFHNHLGHHILALHDLGAPAEFIQAMYDKEESILRPLHLNGNTGAESKKITEANWTGSLGEENEHIYPEYLAFFSSEIAKHGVTGALERYIFSPAANGNGTMMLTRFMSGLFHPIIQTGFGIEFGQDCMVASGLALAAVTAPQFDCVMDPSGVPEIKVGPPTTLLELLHEVYDSPKLVPMPYERTPITAERLARWITENPEQITAIRDIYSKWTFNLHDDEDFSKKVDECMWQAALLLGSTSKAGRKPRMDFFFMHFLTCALSLRAFMDAVKTPLYKAQLLQAYARTAALFIILRGRPRIDPALVMSYSALPVPTGSEGTPALGKLGSGSPWLALLNNGCLHPEPHVVKSIRALFYCAQRYGDTPAGAVRGAIDNAGKETHAGMAELDGTLFIRVAGILTDWVGWVSHGDTERFWDFSGVGWEEAWSNSD